MRRRKQKKRNRKNRKKINKNKQKRIIEKGKKTNY